MYIETNVSHSVYIEVYRKYEKLAKKSKRVSSFVYESLLVALELGSTVHAVRCV